MTREGVLWYLQNARGSPNGTQISSFCDKRASASGIWILRNKSGAWDDYERGMVGYRDTTATQVLRNWICFFRSGKLKRDGTQMETGHGSETNVHSPRIPPSAGFLSILSPYCRLCISVPVRFLSCHAMATDCSLVGAASVGTTIEDRMRG